MVIQSDGKIVVVGDVREEFALARYNTDGSLDTTFGDGGLIVGKGFGYANAVAIQADGKIVVAGFYPRFGDLGLARYTSNGTVDLTFGTGGRVTTAGLGEAKAVVIQTDGKIVTASSAPSPRPDSGQVDDAFVIARYQSNGLLDTTFNPCPIPGFGDRCDGIRAVHFPGASGISSRAEDVALQRDGRIVASGHTNSRRLFALARFNSDGSLDANFDGDGMLTTDVTAAPEWHLGQDRSFAVAIQPDDDKPGEDKIVATGESGDFYGGAFSLTRYNADGSLDETLAGDGKAATDFGSEQRDIALQPDGKILLFGSSGERPFSLAFALARFGPSGSLDPSFGKGGTVTTVTRPSSAARDLALQSDGMIVAAGWVSGGHLALARYRPDGSLDPSFGTEGMVMASDEENDGAEAVAIQPDGRIVVAGNKSLKFAVTRYTRNGSIDTTFAGDGTVTTSFPDGAVRAWALAVQPDGNIVVAGSSWGGARGASSPSRATARMASSTPTSVPVDRSEPASAPMRVPLPTD